ncbi:glycoside hydrolase superfamily, partial [Piptocephalis cylindrospora]
YWGQNSYGASHPADQANYEGRLRNYCSQPVVASTIVLSFLHIFHGTPPNLPGVNFANHCDIQSTFNGTSLLHCPEIGQDIKFCQSQGVRIVLGLGGAAGSYGFSSDAEGEAFSHTIWDLFLGGSSQYRPFDDARLNGINLDIEGGSQTGYIRFIQSLQAIAKANDPLTHYSVSAAPQCPIPDAYMSSIMERVFLDDVYVQFYNNYCGVNAYTTSNFNWDSWATWATSSSVNPKVRLYLGIPASPTAASFGYVEANVVGEIVSDIRSRSPSVFSGVMMWDASQAYANDRYGQAV